MKPGAQHDWVVLAADSLQPVTLVFKGRYKVDARGTFWFVAEFDSGTGDWRMVRTVLERV